MSLEAEQPIQVVADGVGRTTDPECLPGSDLHDLVELAAQLAGTPFAGLLLLKDNRVVCDLSLGVSLAKETGSGTFQALTLAQPEVLQIADAQQYAPLAGHPLVAGAPHLRLFAGVPLGGSRSEDRGVLYVADPQARSLPPAQLRGLQLLARQVDNALELRRQQQRADEALLGKDHLLTQLHSSETRFRTFMNNCPFLTFIKDEQGRFVFYNSRFSERFGISADEWIGKRDREIWSPEDVEQFEQHDAEVHQTGRLQESLEETRDAAGRLTLWRSYKFPWVTETGERWLGAFAVDVTEENQRQRELEQANLQLAKLATSDPLTGLGNRRVLDERVEFEYRFAKRHKADLAVIMLDLDNFKLRNDLFGHDSGDEVLRRVGKLIARTLRTTDMAARYGGEEFVILLPKADISGAELFLERFLESMRREAWPHAPVTASVGIAAMEPETLSGKQLIAQADLAMYEAKRAGRNRIVTYPQVQAAAIAATENGPRG